jgi:thioredoxin 1
VRHGPSHIFGDYSLAEDKSSMFDSDQHEREGAFTPTLQHILEQPVLENYQHWGINEWASSWLSSRGWWFWILRRDQRTTKAAPSWIRNFGLHANKKLIVNNNVLELNEANFDREVLNAAQPVLVGFWASWSDPCRAMVPMLESVAEDEAVSVKVARVNVEDHENLTEQYGVRSVPTLLIFHQGGLQDLIVGRTTEQVVRERLDRLKWISKSQFATETWGC